MNWTQINPGRFESPEGYLIFNSPVEDRAPVSVARAPRAGVIYSGRSLEEAKAACEQHVKGRPE